MDLNFEQMLTEHGENQNSVNPYKLAITFVEARDAREPAYFLNYGVDSATGLGGFEDVYDGVSDSGEKVRCSFQNIPDALLKAEIAKFLYRQSLEITMGRVELIFLCLPMAIGDVVKETVEEMTGEQRDQLLTETSNDVKQIKEVVQ